jgi:Tfp pilus assembly protein PilX
MVTNNVRMDNVAQQYAEAALRYCEAQLRLKGTCIAGDAVGVTCRVATLQTAVPIPLVDMTVAGTVGAWENPLSWTAGPGGGGAASTRTVLGANQYSSGSSSYAPARAPECVVERQTMGATPFIVAVVTARGFSPDYQSDNSGNTTHGAVVWLQSLLNLDPNDLP